MRKLFIWILFFLSTWVFVFAQSDCENPGLFFVESFSQNSVKFSSIFCESGKLQTLNGYSGSLASNTNVALIDTSEMTVTPANKSQLREFAKNLKEELLYMKKTYSSRGNILWEFIKNPQEFDSIAFQILEQFVFTPEEKKVIQNARNLSHIDKEMYENTYWERLLMWGKIISREEWGADENISKKSVYAPECVEKICVYPTSQTQLSKNYLKNFQLFDNIWRKEKTYDDGRDTHRYYPVDRIIIHHTASKYVATKEEGIAYMQSLQKYHGKTLRWSDIGYHYLIDGEGNIYEGRAGWKYVLWAHVATHNYGSVGIALMSDGEYSPKMLLALQELSVYLAWEYGLDLTTPQYVRNADLTWVELGDVLVAHKELEEKKPLDPKIDMATFREGLKNYVQLEKFLVE